LEFRVSSEQKTLATWEVATEQYSISDRYVVWAGRSFDATSYGKDVFYDDLLTEQTHHLEETRPFNVTMFESESYGRHWFAGNHQKTIPADRRRMVRFPRFFFVLSFI
jgi:hypothetical protein